MLHIYIYIFVYIYVCVCVCIYIYIYYILSKTWLWTSVFPLVLFLVLSLSRVLPLSFPLSFRLSFPLSFPLHINLVVEIIYVFHRCGIVTGMVVRGQQCISMGISSDRSRSQWRSISEKLLMCLMKKFGGGASWVYNLG